MTDFNPPPTVRIGFADFTLRPMSVEEAIAVDHTGVTHEGELIIEYNPHAPAVLVVNTILHEIMHACWGAGNLPPKCKEERAVATLADQLSQVLRDNPGLIIRMVTALNPEKE